jgi:hypothetical protein
MKTLVLFLLLIPTVAVADIPANWPSNFAVQVDGPTYASLLAPLFDNYFSHEVPHGHIVAENIRYMDGVYGTVYDSWDGSDRGVNYYGTSRPSFEGRLVYKFETGFNITQATFWARSRTYGDAYVNTSVSTDGINWTALPLTQDFGIGSYNRPVEISSLVANHSDVWVQVLMKDDLPPDQRVHYSGAQFAPQWDRTPSFAFNAVGTPFTVPEPSSVVLALIGLIALTSRIFMHRGY